MRIKGLNQQQLERRLNYIKKKDPYSRWIKYIQYHIKRFKGGNG